MIYIMSYKTYSFAVEPECYNFASTHPWHDWNHCCKKSDCPGARNDVNHCCSKWKCPAGKK